MWPSVQAAWVPINSKWEGVTYWLYADSLGWITTGMGNKVDPLSDALAVQGWTINGAPAGASDITAAWNTVNATVTAPKGQVQPGLPAKGGFAYQSLTSLRLTPAAVSTLVSKTLASFETYLKPHFPGWAKMPADAQFCILSMAWAMGPGFASQFTQFDAAINRGDYLGAVPLAVFKGNGVQTRIAANQQMLRNAAAVVANGADPSALYYPGQVPMGSGSNLSLPTLTTTDWALIAIGAGVSAAAVAVWMQPRWLPAWARA